MKKRVVITGMGIVNPSGNDLDEFWKHIVTGKNSMELIPEFKQSGLPTQVAGKLKNFDPRNFVPRRYLGKIDTFTKYAWTASVMAIQDAALDLSREDRNRIGVWLGNNAGGWDICERGLYEMYREGPEYVNPWQATAWFLSSPQGFLTIAHDLHGMSKSFVCDRASSASALYFAFKNIQEGVNDVILAGGTEAPITPFAMTCYYDIGEMATTADSTQKYKPFDQNSNGLLIGEGAAILVFEELEHAKKRGAPIYGEILGGASFTDSNPSQSHYFAQTMATTLAKSHLQVEQVDVIFAEGAGVPQLDQIESEAIDCVFSNCLNNLIVTCPKSGFGHLYGASSATDLICGLLSAKNKTVVPTPNSRQAAAYVHFDLATEPISREINYFLINSRAREGSNFSLAIHFNPTREVV